MVEDMSNLTIKLFPGNIEVFPNSLEEDWHVSIDTDGLNISEELKTDPDTDADTVVDNWSAVDIEYIEETAGRRLTDEEKEEYIFKTLDYYKCR